MAEAAMPHGAEHLRAMLVGSILTVSPADVLKVALLYASIGFVHWLCRRPFLLISIDPDRAWREGLRVRAWDLLFYATFGLVVTSSVRIAGVLLVFSYLIVPALAAMALGGTVTHRLVLGWAFGAAVSRNVHARAPVRQRAERAPERSRTVNGKLDSTT